MTRHPMLPLPPEAASPEARRAASSPRSRGARRALALGCLLALALLEGGVRALGLAPATPSEYAQFVPDDVLPWKPAPHSTREGTIASGEFDYRYVHNGAGFRDREHSLAKPADTFRIVAVGDSFTYGVGASANETWPARLEQALEALRLPDDPHFEVLNLGIPRYWPEPEALVVEHYGLRYAPDLVVVAFLANDFNDTLAGLDGLQVSRGFLLTRAAARLGPLAGWLYEHVHVARWGLARLAAFTTTAAPPRDPEAVWDEILGHYEHIVSRAHEAGARVAFLHIPQRAPWAAWAPDPPRRVAAFCAHAGCALIDVLPAAMAQPQPTRLHFPLDGHCTPEGYALVADVLLDGLVAREWLPLSGAASSRHIASVAGDD